MQLETYGETGKERAKKLFADIKEKGAEKYREYKIKQEIEKQEKKELREHYKKHYSKEKEKARYEAMQQRAKQQAYSDVHRGEQMRQFAINLFKQKPRKKSSNIRPHKISAERGYDLGFGLSPKSFSIGPNPLLTRGRGKRKRKDWWEL